MFTYILPTIFKSPRFETQLHKVLRDELISEVILIINNGKDEISWLSHPKLTKVIPGSPQYCNGAWNIGARLAKTRYIILATDDIEYDTHIFSIVKDKIYRNEDVGIIGCNQENLSKPVNIPTADKITYTPHISRPHCFGQLMFLHIDYFMQIPEEIKHWYGDDWIFYYNNLAKRTNYSITGDFWVRTSIAESSSGSDTQNRIQEDTKWWEQNNEPFKQFFYK